MGRKNIGKHILEKTRSVGGAYLKDIVLQDERQGRKLEIKICEFNIMQCNIM